MRNAKDNKAYLRHIKDAADKILTYASTASLESFAASGWDQDALMHNLEIIGEAANNIESDFRAKYPDIPWRTIISLRNTLIHDYSDVDINVVWQIVTVDLPKFHKQIVDILSQ